ncbi:ABC transporter ATP-binding protein [Litchfieldella qijiaojingensis]|uniref:ABC transporter ATP-binding protein n=1 Tax=Litchfieldella qijiaojingensis TaxID=980347 RepID=A0ABQ2Z9X7_9GAMM|nr:ABC transporter ATP-binding protein [Halomonas qijiaojingensis]GGY06572.1 ABC transporter ATP-binding protein [Halomonas qijiaojingensis]
MINNIKEILFLIDKKQRRNFVKLQILVIVMSLSEIVSVVAIGPFMALVGDIDLLESDGWISWVYEKSNLDSPEFFLFWMGVGVLSILIASGLFSIFTVWRLSMYGAYIGAELGNRLFKHYMYKPWLFHAGNRSSNLTKQISQEVQRLTSSVIIPLMQMNAKLVMASLMSITVFIYDPMVALAGISIFVISYLLLYKTVRLKLIKYGSTISREQSLRFKLMSEGFGGIKDTLLLGRQRMFINRFENASEHLAKAHGFTQTLSHAPRYAMEIIAFGSVIFLILYLLKSYDGNLSSILPVLSFYTLAGFKLLPSFQQIYSNVSRVRANLAAFESIRSDLYESMDNQSKFNYSHGEFKSTLTLKDFILFENIVFRYPGKNEAALNNLSLTIPANHVVGLVGLSGAGKSTAIDVLLGLIRPDQGQILIDQTSLTDYNIRAWQNTLGFVPQSIFLSDASIRDNIAFGLPPEEIDEARVKFAAHMANLDELLMKLPDGLETHVGERGIQLSGGQRQRIGIARALYDDAKVLILDEATSALDGITEKVIMDAIHKFSGSKTIIMIAHRLATVKQCHKIYLLEQGCVLDHGTYDELISRNLTFRRMAEHA